MSTPSEDGVMTLAMDWVRQHLVGRAGTATEVTPETDLLTTGLLDSIAFVELIAFLESETERQIDLIDADPAEFTTLRGLCRLATEGSTE